MSARSVDERVTLWIRPAIYERLKAYAHHDGVSIEEAIDWILNHVIASFPLLEALIDHDTASGVFVPSDDEGNSW